MCCACGCRDPAIRVVARRLHVPLRSTECSEPARLAVRKDKNQVGRVGRVS